jgi:hypothetical protein
MKPRIILLIALVALLVAVGASAQMQTGTIVGRILDEQGAVLPGVTVTLAGGQGSQTQVTDEKGEYRFVGLTPGTYELKTDLAGFAPRTERNLDVGLARTLTVNLTLKLGGLTESVDVISSASTIDLTSPSTENTISQDLLGSMPLNIGTFNTATALLNYTPGINNGSAFGGDSSYGNALLIDGVDTRDPEAGSAWVFYNFNIIDEVQVSGLGASAEYGGFSGAVVNTITKSGSNAYRGLFEGRFTNESLAGKNITSELLKQNGGLGDSNVLKKLTDYTVQLGGPIRRDKAFWWASVQRYSFEQNPAGTRTKSTEVSPRYNGKLTFNLTPNDSLIGSIQYDNYNVTGRAGYPGATLSTDDQTLRQDSPEAVWNAQYRKVFNSSTFLEAKYTGYWGYYYLDPVNESPVVIDNDTGEYFGGAGYYYYADRGRNQVNVSLSKYAEAFGTHSFKFGIEIERSTSHSRSEYSSCGTIGACYVVQYSGVPYYAYSGLNYDVNGKNKRESYFAQDAWKKGRLTVNLGLRLDRIRGDSLSLNKNVYAPDLAVGPRIGGVFDLTGAGSSVIRAFWGRYFEGTSLSPFANAVGGFEDFVSYEVIGGKYLEFDRSSSLIYRMADSPKHFGVDETNLSFEQQIRRDMRFTVTGIWRDYMNFLGSTLPAARWSPFAYNNPKTGTPMTLYSWANRPAETTGQDYLIQNLDGYRFYNASNNPIPGSTPNRKYKGAMFVLSKSLSNNWQGQFSYVWSETTGNINNAGRTGFGGSSWENPTLALVNTEGKLSNDRTHELKIMGGYNIPKIDVGLNAFIRSISGGTYTPIPSSTVSSRTLNWFSSLRPNLEPLGTYRYPTLTLVDLRIDKSFKVGANRFMIWMDAGNLFNASTVTGRQTRYPNRTINGFNVAYDGPTTITGARQITIGGRWSF